MHARASATPAAQLNLIDANIRELRQLRKELARLVAACAANAGEAHCPVITLSFMRWPENRHLFFIGAAAFMLALVARTAARARWRQGSHSSRIDGAFLHRFGGRVLYRQWSKLAAVAPAAIIHVLAPSGGCGHSNNRMRFAPASAHAVHIPSSAGQ